MKLEQNDKSMLFSCTEIPDVFFTEYLSSANGDYIKVYLYILFLSKYDKDIKVNDLSKKLALPFKTIQNKFYYALFAHKIITSKEYIYNILTSFVIKINFRSKKEFQNI